MTAVVDGHLMRGGELAVVCNRSDICTLTTTNDDESGPGIGAGDTDQECRLTATSDEQDPRVRARVGAVRAARSSCPPFI